MIRALDSTSDSSAVKMARRPSMQKQTAALGKSEMSGGAEHMKVVVSSHQTLASQPSVEDDVATTRSNSDDEHPPTTEGKKSRSGQQGHILDSYTKIWETFPEKKSQLATVGGAAALGTSSKGSPILGFQSIMNTSPTLSSSSQATPISMY